MPRREYDRTFYRGQAGGSLEAARWVVPILVDLLDPTSMLDIGCGVGTWVAAFRESGVADVVGVDGDYIDVDQLVIPTEHFVSRDLTQRIDLGRRFDLVISLEVGEHLDARYAETFMDTVTRHGDLVLFGAAIPGQGGKHHVNEQWPSYWVEKFRARDFEVFDVLRPRIWNVTDVPPFYRQNTLVYARGAAAESVRYLPPAVWPDAVAVVHPDLWTTMVNAGPTARQIVRHAVPAFGHTVRTSVAKRLRGAAERLPFGLPSNVRNPMRPGD